jgi:hypothetical protein
MSLELKGARLMTGRRRRRQPDMVIPESRANYDLWEMLGKRAMVQVHTIDGMVIHIEKTPDTTVNYGEGRIHAVKFTIWDFGAPRVFENVTCQQHCSVWKVIDPLRPSSFWRFRLREYGSDRTRMTYNGAVQVVAAF